MSSAWHSLSSVWRQSLITNKNLPFPKKNLKISQLIAQLMKFHIFSSNVKQYLAKYNSTKWDLLPIHWPYTGLKPGGHVHLYEPGIFSHLSSQRPASHSLMSEIRSSSLHISILQMLFQGLA